jgi:hypothetical protein
MYPKSQNILNSLLLWAITWTMIWAPIVPLRASDISGDPALLAQKEECDNTPGRQWNHQTNSCQFTTESVDTRDAMKACESDPDPSACFERQAQAQSGVSKGDRASVEEGQTAATIAALYGLYLGVMTAVKSDFGAWCNSKTILVGASAAWFVGDFYLKSSAEDTFEEFGKKFEKQQAGEDDESSTFNSQVAAFEYLKKEQEIVEDMASKRASLYLIAALAFAIATGFAIFETTQMATNATVACLEGGTSKLTGKDAVSNVKANIGLGGQFASIWLKTSPQIAIGSGILGLWANSLRTEALEEEETAQKNIKSIEEALAGFRESTAGFCPEGRSDPKAPRCYCFLDGGARNPSRTNSGICQQLFLSEDEDFTAGKTDYTTKKAPGLGCVTVNGKFDKDCRCKNFKESKTGQNACAKFQASPALLGGLGGTLGVPQTAPLLNSFTEGDPNAFANLNSGRLSQNLARVKKINQALLKKAKQKGSNLGTINNHDALAKNFTDRAVTAITSRQRKGASLGAIAARSRPKGALGALLKQPSTKAGIKKPSFSVSGGKGLSAGRGKSGQKNGLEFDFSGSGTKSPKVLNLPDSKPKNYNYKEADINKRKDVSIFKIISNRYLNSGLRRLFEE